MLSNTFGRILPATLTILMLALTTLATKQPAVAQDANAAEHSNRLAKESSPYLLQHAHNPVDWYPWGDEAFERAKRENKMIFLSVGYAACHWCHVMERESFVDLEIAKVMNDNFVCIKVDREERPDVDQIYMLAVQLISGHGGWPMSVFLTPDSKPFWGGTYFAARDGDRGGSTGFLSILKQVDRAWVSHPDVVRKQAESLTQAIKQHQKSQLESNDDPDSPGSRPPNAADVRRVASALADQFDPKYGGFGYSAVDPNRPKFPEATKLVFLLDRMQRPSVASEDREQAQEMLIKTLDAMISGAMFDHLGGGFHRYSVDRRWQIPHFEKMLYDNGQLASVFAQAYRLTGREEYRRVCERTCDFVIRELNAPGGGFYSSLDADSEGEEGAFYRWSREQLAERRKQIDTFELLSDVYRLNGKANFEGEYFVPDPGRTLTAIATQRGISFDKLEQQLSQPRHQMWQHREQRLHPQRDTKVLTAWNGLMIAGLADAGRLLDRPDYLDAAAAAASFVLREMPKVDGRLNRTFADDHAKLNAYLDDYAFLVSGLIALHRATDEAMWLDAATNLTNLQLKHFWDDAAGGFFFTSDDHPALIVRFKDPLDGAIPAGNGVAAENLAYLASHSQNNEYQSKMDETLRSVRGLFRRSPSSLTRTAAVVAATLNP